MRLPSRNLAAPLAIALALGAVPGRAWAAGMPQLDFANPLLIGQVVWGAVIFAVFYVILSRSALPRIEGVLTHRRNRIEGDLDIARRARDDADRAVDELRRARHDAAAQAQANIDRVVHEARMAAEAQTHEMNHRLLADIVEAEKRIASARKEALASLPGVAADTAQSLIDKLLRPAGIETAVSRAQVQDAVQAGLAASRG
ncbi:F0F1 ATP synthase subunit B family protein [Asaia platycodi]|uniref:F0F1 ATP synthase subunit B family protein n=1 Tax=Asaia platycodi TaxID=610243 RepID=UPI00046EA8E8|nr:ATP synthase F0 subunit B' [Asaia platycodi]